MKKEHPIVDRIYDHMWNAQRAGSTSRKVKTIYVSADLFHYLCLEMDGVYQGSFFGVPIFRDTSMPTGIRVNTEEVDTPAQIMVSMRKQELAVKG